MSDFVPRYFTIEQSLRSRIAGLDAHAALPSDAQLCEEFGVSRMTARGAVQRLVQEGLVYRVPGRGTFVAPVSANRTASRILSFSDEMRRSGRVPHSRVVASGRRAASDDESRRLGTDEVFSVRRVREADGEPVALETAVFPAARAEALVGRDLEDVSLFAALTEAGHVPTAGTAQLHAERATAEDAKLLGVRAGEPLLVERRLINDQEGVPLELTESRYVGTRYGLDVDFEVELPPVTRELTDLRAGVVGTGFIGAVHIDALRRLGVQVAGVVGSTPGRAAAKALAPVVESYEALLADPAVDVVHLTTPNHLHYPQVKLALEAGKHVVCEKPLATTAAESRELLELAERSGLVHCTNFNIRFYPLVQDARARVQAGEVGEVWNVHGGYLQDWLLLPTDWNWRLEPDKGGELRAVGDIGSHWLDLVQFVTGLEVHEIFADLATAIPVRRRPLTEVETFGSSSGGERVDVEMTTEDFAHILVRFRGGARGSCVVSQVSAGRKNAIGFEVSGSRSALAWEGERPEELWLGHRDTPNATLLRNAALMQPAARPTTHLPAGHAEGFADTFRELYRAVYRAVAAGEPADDYPTFRAGHVENVLAEAVALSNTEQRWMEVTP